LFRINTGGRVACRIIDPEGNQLIQLIDTGGYAGLVAALNANATVAASVFIQLVGTIANAQAFSSAIDDYTFFSGGQ
tara:strand:- start:780 stop:1010 length:231 start_codon:yes stop_codon:yes gene_type:complete